MKKSILIAGIAIVAIAAGISSTVLLQNDTDTNEMDMANVENPTNCSKAKRI